MKDQLNNHVVQYKFRDRVRSERTNKQAMKTKESSLEHLRLRAEHAHAPQSLSKQLRVMKFGGTSVGNESCIRMVMEIIRNSSIESDLVVVVSAMSNVTNRLIEAAVVAQAGDSKRAEGILEELRARHNTVASILIPLGVGRDQINRKIEGLLEECRRLCERTALNGELTPQAHDWISSLGERLSAPLVAAALEVQGIKCKAVEATELVITDSHHGAAEPKIELTRANCELRLRPLLQQGIIPIVTGFIGATENGVLTTLGRGGSDYSATILGAALEADEVFIWTDVDGVLTADPRLVPEATTIPEISYREAAELAYFGAKVLHSKTLHPVMQSEIPVRVVNTFAPEKAGTKITPVADTGSEGVKAITTVNEAVLITVICPTEDSLSSINERILTATKAVRANVLMISSSFNCVLLVVSASSAPAVVEALRCEFESDFKHKTTEYVSSDATVAILTVVGSNLSQGKEIVDQAIEGLVRKDIKIIATAQGFSECNISFVVSRKDIEAALQATHRKFELNTPDLSANEKTATPAQNAGYRESAQVFPWKFQTQGNSESTFTENLTSKKTSTSTHGERISERQYVVLDEISFQRMIVRERKRTERSQNPMLLVLLDVGNFMSFDQNGKALNSILNALSSSTRDTDVTGWYKNNAVVGVMFTEIGMDDHGAILGTMMERVSGSLRNNLSLDKFSQISISFHVFPEDWNQETSPGNLALYPDLVHQEKAQRGVFAIKRFMDIAGSVLAILLLAPVFLLVAALVKLSSKGPMLYKQERIGQLGKPFTFLKFRSMYVNNNPKIHQEFMKRVIGGNHDGGASSKGGKVYKMTNDPRITRIGGFLRRTSLDELPQFFNVLKGEMALVGPRPPLAYECREYEIWHRRRVLEVKPGITGLWQVKGRSRVRFDDMVRLDLQYVRTWSLWLDIQILWKTPGAVLLGGDAF